MRENTIETAAKFLREEYGFGEITAKNHAEELVAYAMYLQQEERLSLEERKQRFVEELRPYLEEVGRDPLNAFAKYWTERTPNGRKMRFEKEKTFDVKRRLVTWLKNSRKFSVLGILERKYAREKEG